MKKQRSRQLKTQRKYHKIIDLTKQADIETARSTYNNGILEVTFDKKKEEPKSKGRDKDRIRFSLNFFYG